MHLGLQYEWTMGLGQLLARVDTVWVDEQFSAPFNRQDRDLMDSYHRTNAQLSWESDSQLWQASLYVQNLEDDDVVANLFDGSDQVGLPVAVYGHYFDSAYLWCETHTQFLITSKNILSRGSVLWSLALAEYFYEIVILILRE